MEIRALRADDERSGFHSGDEALDRFFHRYAGQNQFRHFYGVSYVAVDEARIVGFVTVAPRHFDLEDLPEIARKGLPRYPAPALGLMRLAVDETARSQGIGRRLLAFVMQLAAKLADEVGCAAVVVDAKPDAVDFYAKYGFTRFESIEGQTQMRPSPVEMYLLMQDIKAATRPVH